MGLGEKLNGPGNVTAWRTSCSALRHGLPALAQTQQRHVQVLDTTKVAGCACARACSGFLGRGRPGGGMWPGAGQHTTPSQKGVHPPRPQLAPSLLACCCSAGVGVHRWQWCLYAWPSFLRVHPTEVGRRLLRWRAGAPRPWPKQGAARGLASMWSGCGGTYGRGGGCGGCSACVVAPARRPPQQNMRTWRFCLGGSLLPARRSVGRGGKEDGRQ